MKLAIKLSLTLIFVSILFIFSPKNILADCVSGAHTQCCQHHNCLCTVSGDNQCNSSNNQDDKCGAGLSGICNCGYTDCNFFSCTSGTNSCTPSCPSGLFMKDDTCVAKGGGGTSTPAPTCNCGTQQCDSSVAGCQCFYIGCHVGTAAGPGCVKYSCGGGGGGSRPSCTIGFVSSSVNVSSGGSAAIGINVNSTKNGSISSIKFSSSNTNIAFVFPASDTTAPYASTVFGGINAGTAIITANGIMSGSSRCSTTMTTHVLSSPWWQVKESDVVSNGPAAFI